MNWIQRFLAAIATHKGDASAHHAKYTDAEAQTTVKANVEVGDLKAPTKALAMNNQKITGLAAPAATNDAVRADANLRAPDSSKLEGSSKATVQDHTPKAHTLASHSTKAHTELTGVTANQHHPQSHNAASHSDIASSGADIDDAVAKKHAQAHTLASHSTKAHTELTGVTANQHHTPAWTLAETLSPSAINTITSSTFGAHDLWMVIFDVAMSGGEANFGLQINSDAAASYYTRYMDALVPSVATLTFFLLVSGDSNGRTQGVIYIGGRKLGTRLQMGGNTWSGNVNYNSLVNATYDPAGADLTSMKFLAAAGTITGKISIYYKDL